MFIIVAAVYAALSSNDWFLVAIPATATILGAWIARGQFQRNKNNKNYMNRSDKKQRELELKRVDMTTAGFMSVIGELSRHRQEAEDRLDIVERKYAVLEEKYSNLEEKCKTLQDRYERLLDRG